MPTDTQPEQISTTSVEDDFEDFDFTPEQIACSLAAQANGGDCEACQ